MSEHPVQQPITGISIDSIPGVEAGYDVGRNGVTSIEACTKSGLHANIPYVRVWAGDHCLAEFCQHQIVGVYFGVPDPETSADDVARWKAAGISNIVNGKCTSCEMPDAECDCLPF